MRRLGWFWGIGLLLVLGWAQPLESIPNPRATYGGWIADLVGVFSEQQKQALNDQISRIEQETGVEIAIVVLRRAVDATPKEYATELFNRWGVGKKGADNGLLLLLAIDNRRVEIETGYGLEPILPDAVVGAILDEYALPYFRQGRYAEGIQATVEAIEARIRSALASGAYEPPVSETRPASAGRAGSLFLLPIVLIAGIGILVVVGVVLWERPPRCPNCKQPMRLLDERADDAYLNELQLLEEKLGSVNYQVWRCEACELSEIIPKVAWFSEYDTCPRCGGRTLYERARIVREPTYTRTGLEVTLQRCKNPKCGYRNERERVLPKRQREVPIVIGGWTGSSSDSWGGGILSGGGFGGGSFGGGSFGGGSSGGGGAGRGW